MVKKSTSVWMLEDDLNEFGLQLKLVLPQASWMCSQVGPQALHQVHLHATVGAAMQCGGGTQSFLPLPAGAEPPPNAIVEPLVSIEPGLKVAALVQVVSTRQIPAGPFAGPSLEAGWVSLGWDASKVGPQLHDLLDAQANLVWKALREVTKPAPAMRVGDLEVTGARVGMAARRFSARTGTPMQISSEERLLNR